MQHQPVKRRALVLVIDSFGIGSSEDAQIFADQGANTLGHIADTFSAQNQPFNLNRLNALGLGEAYRLVHGDYYPGYQNPEKLLACFGYAAEQSLGKDTPSGHWEMMGVPVLDPWGFFPKEIPCFPQNLIDELCLRAGLPGILANQHASGTEIIQQFFDAHKTTDLPICYTSADSVFQIAAHEDYFGLDRLYQLCETAFELLKPYRIARVIARPFSGTSAADCYRTHNRRDYALKPPRPTLLDQLKQAGGSVIAIGKISDIFAHQGITHPIKAHGIDQLIKQSINQLEQAAGQSLIFTNLVDFDQNFGHRRDPTGYGQALMQLDQLLPGLLQAMQPDDLLLITADHGCDPTWPGSDHTREYVPLLCYQQNCRAQSLGRRSSFADLGQTLADYFGLDATASGTSFYPQLIADHSL